MIPIVGDLIQSTVGNVVDRLVGKYLPESMSEQDRENLKLEARRLSIDEYKTAIADVQGARKLASDETVGAPGWTKILTVTHRPIWSFLILGLFAWTVLAPYFGFDEIKLTGTHKEIMQTVIIFYFGGRTVEKATSYLRPR